MALLGKRELCEMYGINTRYLATYIGRKKIILTDDNLIDTNNEINAVQLAKFAKNKAKNELKNGITPTSTEILPQPKPQKKTKEIKAKVPVDEVSKSEHAKAKFVLDLQDKIRQADLDNKLLTAKQKQIELAKKRGDLIPVDQVKTIIQALSSSFQENYKNQSELLLINIAQKTKMDESDQAHFKGELFTIINKSHRDSVEDAKQGMKALIEQSKKKKT